MRLLILGGTMFLGRHLVEAAQERGHDVTLFNRGRTNPDLFPDVERIQGDRTQDLSGLRGSTWDAVVDTSGYLPRVVRQSAEALRGAVGRYAFISSLSVYADTRTPGMNEEAPVGTLEDPASEDVNAHYGPLKALCEQAVEEVYGARALVIRPGLIVGRYDPSDRFTYWPVRISQGGEVLAPGSPSAPVQLVDARDLAEWTIRMLERDGTGVYNATGPDYPLTMGRLLDTCIAVSGADAVLDWVDDQFLLDSGVKPWTELPLWIPSSDPDFAGFSAIDCSRAIRAGLTFRPLEHTVRETLRWASEWPEDHTWRAGMVPEREGEILRAWHGREHTA